MIKSNNITIQLNSNKVITKVMISQQTYNSQTYYCYYYFQLSLYYHYFSICI